MNILTKFFLLSLAFFLSSCDLDKFKTVQIGNKIWMAENYTSELQLGDGDRKVCYSSIDKDMKVFLYEDAVRVCPSGWHLPTDEEWENLTRYTQYVLSDYDKSIGISKALMKGRWSAGDVESDCEGEFGSAEFLECEKRNGNIVDGPDIVGFGAVGVSEENYRLGSICREGCGGWGDGQDAAYFWSASGKIFAIEFSRKEPYLKKIQNPRKGSDDCSDGFGHYDITTAFSLEHVGKTVAAVRCVKN